MVHGEVKSIMESDKLSERVDDMNLEQHEAGTAADAARVQTEESESDDERDGEVSNDLRYNEETGVTDLDSLCMSCGKNGVTKLLMLSIPYFREVILMSFECEHCGTKNSEVQFGGEVQEKGTRQSLRVKYAADLNRQIIKSESASVHIPSLQLEIPAQTQKGSINTIEGLLRRTADDLGQNQDQRRELDPASAARIDSIIADLVMMSSGTWRSDASTSHGDVHSTNAREGEQGEGDDDDDVSLLPSEFEIVVDDPAGNSYIQNLRAPEPDMQLSVTRYVRSTEQNVALGLKPDWAPEEEQHMRETSGATAGGSQQATALPARNEGLDKLVDSLLSRGKAGAQPDLAPSSSCASTDADRKENEEDDESEGKIGYYEPLQFPTQCANCRAPGNTVMCLTSIPHFKEIIIMAFNCGQCGFRSNEIKAGGAIPTYGEKIILSVKGDDPSDMSRDVLKSDTSGIRIPELELEITRGSLGGMYTTVEGLLQKVRERMVESNPFAVGDSADQSSKEKFNSISDQLAKLEEGRTPFTLILEDPLANSFIYNPHAPEADPKLSISEYTRSYEEEEELGLLDMRTENYAEEAAEAQDTAQEQRQNEGEKAVVVSDKEAMKGSRTTPWLTEAEYHPLPEAVQEMKAKSEEAARM